MSDPLYEKDLEDPMPYEIARTRVGQVAIANSDAAWTPFAHVAIDQANRAVGELLEDR
jgi:spermidine dehydrogenase